MAMVAAGGALVVAALRVEAAAMRARNHGRDSKRSRKPKHYSRFHRVPLVSVTRSLPARAARSAHLRRKRIASTSYHRLTPERVSGIAGVTYSGNDGPCSVRGTCGESGGLGAEHGLVDDDLGGDPVASQAGGEIHSELLDGDIDGCEGESLCGLSFLARFRAARATASRCSLVNAVIS